ncbi:MAG: DUF262 domain-containing protein [Sedimentisphaerales bacterium]|nr:DUF262 domain-containing protein [Sedimentisphaerales bacterium]
MEFNSSEQTVVWFKDRYLEDTLTIRPPYQRKPIWSAKQKCYLVESILLGLPVPEIYIQQSISARGESTYAIVDGQQRIRSVLQFVGSENDPMESEQNKFPLDKLKSDSQWRNKTFDELSEEEKRRFYGYKFVVRYLNTDNDDEVRDIFQRLNKYLTPLKPQELRNATYTGPFIKLAEKLADDEYWAENRIVTPAAIRRMTDIEFMSELLIGVMHGPQGGSARIIDEYYKQYEDYEDQFPDQLRAERLFALTLETVQRILPEIKGTRWGNKTDFYTLFVALAYLLRSAKLSQKKNKDIRRSLDNFAREIDRRLRDEDADVSEKAIEYVRAVEKGANEKKRRADRQAALIGIINRYFEPKQKIS